MIGMTGYPAISHYWVTVETLVIRLSVVELGWSHIIGLGGCHTRFLEGKSNMNHVRARISNSRTQQFT